MWWLVLSIAVAVPGLYGLYTLYVVLRLALQARKIRRECAARDLGVDWSLFLFFPSDFEDPFTLHVTIRSGRHGFSFTVFRSFLPAWVPSDVRIEPLALSDLLHGSVYIDPKDHPSTRLSGYLLERGEVEVRTLGVEALDARYRVCEEKTADRDADNLALVRAALMRSDVDELLSASGAGLAFEGGRARASRSARDRPFLQWVEEVARLADALDDSVKHLAGPYR